MGTSQSSDGSPSGVPMVPPWVPVLPLPLGEPDIPPGDDGQESMEPTAAPPAFTALPVPIAPAGRFAAARKSLGGYARTGDKTAMRRGVGHYIRSGYGGSGTAVRRFGGSASTAAALYRVLSGGAAGLGPGTGQALDRTLLEGHSAREVIDAVIEAVRPIDGTQDAEASRAAIGDALSELLARFPDSDLLNLTPDQRAFAIERYVAMDVFRRLDLDLGKMLREKAPSAMTALARLKEVRDYVKETVAASFRRLRDAGRALNAGRIDVVVRAALAETFQVFESYAI